jgi:ABC-type tungstate transport system permease subunit
MQLPISASASDVVGFCSAFKLTDTPVYLFYHNQSYGPDWCHVSEADPKLITQNQCVAFNQSIEMPSWQTRSAAQTSDFVGFG